MKRTFFETKLWKVIELALVIAAAGMILGGTCVLIRYKQVSKTESKPEVIEQAHYVTENGSETPAIGEVFHAELTVRVPWHDSPQIISAGAGENLQLTEDPYFSREKIRWGYNDWKITVPLQGYRNGEGGKGKVNAQFARGEAIETNLPDIKIGELVFDENDNGDDLSLAPHIDKPEAGKTIWSIVIITASIIVLGAVGYMVFRRVRNKKETAKRKMPWDHALESIDTLRKSVQGGSISTENAIGQLTDVERKYLEERFQLKAERQTTPEFMADLERNEELLSDRDRKHLRSFLTAADMVKFARLPADQTLFENASERAEELVRATIPHDGSEHEEKGERK